jgi:CRISPR-associated protein Cmr4
MFQEKKALFLICETPLHAGSGSDLGIVDLPIQRERHTSFPKIESSSLKGALREAVETHFINKGEDAKRERKHDTVYTLFGPENAGNNAHMGAVGFSDARLLLFPVKSMKGVFAWITCPKVLQQFERDMKITNENFSISNVPTSIGEGECIILNSKNNITVNKSHVVLEEYAFSIKKEETSSKEEMKVSEKEDKEGDEKEDMKLNNWLAYHASKEAFFQDKMSEDIIIMSNDDFKDFVNLSTEVITRTAIDNETGTVKGGALFTEEFLPAESVMYSLVMAAPPFNDKRKTWNAKKVMETFTTIMTALPVVQIGGGATLGKGIVRTKIV